MKFRRFIDDMCYIANRIPPFVGFDLSSTSLNRGNFLRFLNMLQNIDAPLENRLGLIIFIEFQMQIRSLVHGIYYFKIQIFLKTCIK